MTDKLNDAEKRYEEISGKLSDPEEQQYLAAHIRDSHYVMIENSGHASMYEQPMLFASLIVGFANASKDRYNIV